MDVIGPTSALQENHDVSTAEKAGLEIPTGCLTGSCGACEIDVNGETVRACISNIKSKKERILNVSLTTDPFWEN